MFVLFYRYPKDNAIFYYMSETFHAVIPTKKNCKWRFFVYETNLYQFIYSNFKRCLDIHQN